MKYSWDRASSAEIRLEGLCRKCFSSKSIPCKFSLNYTHCNSNELNNKSSSSEISEKTGEAVSNWIICGLFEPKFQTFRSVSGRGITRVMYTSQTEWLRVGTTLLMCLGWKPAISAYLGSRVMPGQVSSVGLPSSWNIFRSWSSSSIPGSVHCRCIVDV